MADTRALIVDIETGSIADAETYLEPVSAPDNYKDPVKIAAYEADARQKQIDRCALDPDLCRVVAIGYMLEDWSEPEIVLARTQQEECEALEQFWRLARLPNNTTRPLVTFDGLKFDLPVLMRRSLYLHVAHPILNLDKYRTPHIDLYARLTHNGTIDGHKLRFYMARFGIHVDDMTSGKDIAGLIAAGDWTAVAEHCKADVIGTKALAHRLGYLTAPTPVLADAPF